METALANLYATFDKGAKAFQEAVEKEVAQRVEELKKRERELELKSLEFERTVALREKRLEMREKSVEQRENGVKSVLSSPKVTPKPTPKLAFREISTSPGPGYRALREAPNDLDQREAALTQRDKAVEQRERALEHRSQINERASSLREKRLEAREQAVEQREKSMLSSPKVMPRPIASQVTGKAPTDVDQLERALRQREKAAEQREKALEQRENALKTKTEKLSVAGSAKPESPKEVEGMGEQDGPGKAKRVKKQKQLNWSNADPKKWQFIEVESAGNYAYGHTEPALEQIEGSIAKGIEYLKQNPRYQEGLFYQTAMLNMPEAQQKFTVIKRSHSGFHMTPKAGGKWRWLRACYRYLPDIDQVDADECTKNLMICGGKKMTETLMPGRGQGCCDIPNLRLIEVAHPRGVRQGAVGDCWLLCAISAVAEYEGVIEKMFKKTPGLSRRPSREFNKYTITLYDLSTDVNVAPWKPVDIVVDERLTSKPAGGLLACHPSNTGELWACYLEKAIAAHCGGWDEIEGGRSTHAWRLMLGCKDVYNFHRVPCGKWSCFGRYSPVLQKWEQMANSLKRGSKKVWPMDWPPVGGGGQWGSTVDDDNFFDRMTAWDEANYIMCAGTTPGSDKEEIEGIVQGHAYTVLKCVENVAGTKFDLIKVRNPWGAGEFTAGKWVDDGDGWEEYPQVKQALKPEAADNGIFWMQKEEFFGYFPTLWLCALDMTTLQK